MAVSAVITPNPANVNQTVTYQYTVTEVDDRTVLVSGNVMVDGVPTAPADVTLVVKHNVVFQTPTAPGLSFSPVSGAPGRYTAVV